MSASIQSDFKPDQNIEAALEAGRLAAQHGIDLSKLPTIMDMSAESITENVHAINSNCQDERMKFLFKSLVNHLHDFARETSLTTEEWMTAIQFLTETGKMCSDIRQGESLSGDEDLSFASIRQLHIHLLGFFLPEFILLSDTLGLSSLIAAINNTKPPGATEATVLGPFFTEDAHDVQMGGSIASEGKGEYMIVEGKILDTEGRPIPGAILDTWETDGHGLYDTQYVSRTEPECRGRLRSAEDGSYSFRAVVPVPYPIPSDGTVGAMIAKLGRHPFRPAHIHIMIEAPGFEKLITQLFMRDDPYLTSDAVFGVKTSLVVDLETVTDTATTKSRGFAQAKPHKLLKRDFILVTPEESAEARKSTVKKSHT